MPKAAIESGAADKVVSLKDGIIIAAIPLLSIILRGILSENQKNVLVFWRLKNPLPGCRAFSCLIGKDARITRTNLEHNLGVLPTEPSEQNTLWFDVYKKHQNKTIVLNSHGVYLLTRDMTSISSILFVLFTIGVIFSSISISTTTIYACALAMQYLFISIAARNYGNRFVLNVLSAELSDQ